MTTGKNRKAGPAPASMPPSTAKNGSTINIIDIVYHKNGGNSYHAVIFDDLTKVKIRPPIRRIAVVFKKPGQCAVLATFGLHHHDIGWAADPQNGKHYEPIIRDAIEKFSGLINKM